MAEKAPIFSAPDRAINVPTSGIEQLARAGARLGQMGNEEASAIRQGGEATSRGLGEVGKGVAEVGNAVEQHDITQDISHLGAAHADMLSGLTAQHDAFFQSADPNDPTAATRFQEEYVQPAVDKLSDAASTPEGQRRAAEMGSNLETHFAEMSNQTQSKRAGQAIALNQQQMMDSLTSTVQSHPESIPVALASINTQMAGFAAAHPELSPEDISLHVANLRKNLLYTGAEAKIDQATKAGTTIDMSNYYKTYGADLGGQNVEKLQRYQTEEVDRARTQLNSNQIQADKADKKAFNQTYNDVIGSIIQPDGSIAIPQDYTQNLQAAKKMPGADGTKIKDLVDLQQKVNRDNRSGVNDVDDPVTTKDFNGRLFSSDNPVTVQDVIKAKIAGQLSNQGFKLYSAAAEQNAKSTNPATNEQIKANQEIARSTFLPRSGAGGIPDPSQAGWGSQAYATWNSQFLQGVVISRANGALADYLNPSSPAYWGKNINMSAIARQAKQTYQPLNLSPTTPGVPAEKPAAGGRPSLSSFFGLFGGNK